MGNVYREFLLTLLEHEDASKERAPIANPSNEFVPLNHVQDALLMAAEVLNSRRVVSSAPVCLSALLLPALPRPLKQIHLKYSPLMQAVERVSEESTFLTDQLQFIGQEKHELAAAVRRMQADNVHLVRQLALEREFTARLSQQVALLRTRVGELDKAAVAAKARALAEDADDAVRPTRSSDSPLGPIEWCEKLSGQRSLSSSDEWRLRLDAVGLCNSEMSTPRDFTFET
jgi:hypothetical protein